MGVNENEIIINAEFIYNPLMQSLSAVGDEAIILGVNESRLLQLLVSYPNVVISRNDIHDYVWRVRGDEVDDSSLTQAVATLRKHLSDNPNVPRCIKTEPRIGYRFIGEVELATSTAGIEQRRAITDSGRSFNQVAEAASEMNLINDASVVGMEKTEGFFSIFDIRKHWYNFIVSGFVALIVMLVLCDFNNSQDKLLLLYNKIGLL